MKKVIVAVWMVACAAVLLVTVYAYEPNENRDIGPFFLWLMIALTFPSGLLVASAASLIAMVVGSDARPAISSTVFYAGLWAAFVATGYVQWFRFLPWLWRKMRANSSSSSDSHTGRSGGVG